MKKWIPIYGMFTKEANDIPTGIAGENVSLAMVFYHGGIAGFGISYLLYLIFT